jgi:Flp pilus assembly protein TadD
VFHREGKGDDAEAQYQTALVLDPQQPVTQNNLGLIRLNHGDLDQAEQLFRKELAINPSYDKAHFNLGLVLARRGQLVEAVKSWQQALELNPENDEARSNLNRAGEMIAASHSLGAGSSTPEGIRLAPDDVPADLVVPLFEQALRKDPGNQQLRKAFSELCRTRHLTCPQL